MMVRAWHLATVSLVVAACGSTPPTLVESKPFTQTTELAMPSATVFDALVEVVNASDLRVSTVSKESGVLVVAPKTMSAADMDRYCEFPAVGKDGKPAETFVAYDKQRTNDGKPGVSGTAALSFLVP